MGWMDGMGWDGSPGGPRYRAPTVLIIDFDLNLMADQKQKHSLTSTLKERFIKH